MVKIFISFFNAITDPVNSSAIPCFYESFVEGLKKAGNELLIYSNRRFGADFGPIPEKLLNQIKEFDPELIFLFNNCFYDVSKEFDCPIVIYEVDSPIVYSNKEAIRSNISRYKFLVPQSESVKILTEQWGVDKKNILQVPFFTEIQRENVPQTVNISFIGSKFTNDRNRYKDFCSKFMLTNPDEEEVEVFRGVIEKIKENPFVEKSELLKNIHSEKIYNNVDLIEILAGLSDFNRVQTLAAVADLGLDLYGTPLWMSGLANQPNIVLGFKNKHVYSRAHNQDIYNSSKIGININHLQAKTGFAWRVCDIMASNACLVAEYKPDFSIRFPNIKIPFFSNPYEAREQCIKLLKEEHMRTDIVEACNEIIDEKYRFKHAKCAIEEFLDISLTGSEGHASFIFDSSSPNDGVSLKNKIRMKIHKSLCVSLGRKGLIE